MTAPETNFGTAKAGTKVMTLLEAITAEPRYELTQDTPVPGFRSGGGQEGGGRP